MNFPNAAVINKENSCHSQYSLKFVLKFVEFIAQHALDYHKLTTYMD